MKSKQTKTAKVRRLRDLRAKIAALHKYISALDEIGRDIERHGIGK